VTAPPMSITPMMIINGSRLVHFGKIADISNRRQSVKNFLPKTETALTAKA
jgi:hypothetical protein